MSDSKDKGNNDSVISDRIAEYFDILLDLRTHINQVEECINRTSHLLDRSQPNNSGGKIGIRWWRTDRTAVRTPTLVHWEFAKTNKGKMKPVPYLRPPRKIKTEGIWGINAKQTEELVKHYYVLHEEWSKGMERMSNLMDKRRSRHIDKAKGLGLCVNSNQVLDALHGQIRDNLRENGYLGDM